MSVSTIITIYTPQVIASIPADDTFTNAFTLDQPGVYVLESEGRDWYYGTAPGLPLGSMTLVPAGTTAAFIVSAVGSPVTYWVRSAPTLPTLVLVTYTPGIPSSGPVVTPTVPLVDAATIVTDASLGSVFAVTLTGSRTMAAPDNPTDGQDLTYIITQGGAGTNLVTWDPVFGFGTDVTSPTLSTTSGEVDYVYFRYNAALQSWVGLAWARGYT